MLLYVPLLFEMTEFGKVCAALPADSVCTALFSEWAMPGFLKKSVLMYRTQSA